MVAPGPWDSRAASSVCPVVVQVTLFAYSDLLLFTKEDEPGRCNVLRNPLYLQSVKLQEGKCALQRCPGLPPPCPESPYSGQHGRPVWILPLQRPGCQPSVGHLSMCGRVKSCPGAARLLDTGIPF